MSVVIIIIIIIFCLYDILLFISDFGEVALGYMPLICKDRKGDFRVIRESKEQAPQVNVWALEPGSLGSDPDPVTCSQ